jgi:phage-related protein
MIALIPTARKPCEFVASAREDILTMPAGKVRQAIGFAIFMAQCGERHQSAKPLKGFGGAGVLEVVENFDSNTYRAVYTVKFAGVVYVLHAFQKKSKRGSSTPRHDVGLIGQRLKTAEQHYQQYYRKAG